MKLPRNAAALVLVGGLLAVGGCKSGEFPFFGGGSDKPAAKKEAPAKKDAAKDAAKKDGKAPAAAAKTDDKAPKPAAKTDDKAPKPAAAPPAAKPAEAAGGPSLDALRKDRSVRDQARAQLVAHYLKSGDEAFASSLFEDAEKAYGSALDLDPGNAHASSRMQEVGAILNKRGMTAGDALGRASEHKRVRSEQAKLEVANLAATGDASAKAGDYDTAVRNYERALVIAQLWEPQVDFSPTADGLMARISEARRSADTANETRRRKQLKEVMDQQKLEAAAQRSRERARTQELFRKANMEMERGNYQSAQNLAEEILRQEPQSMEASRLRDIARRARVTASDDQLSATLMDEWKHVFEQLAEAYTPQVSDYTFPDSWNDVQHLRKPRGLGEALFEEDPRDREVRNRLGAARTPVDFKDTSLDDAVDFLARISGVNIVILPNAREGKSDEELNIEALKLDGAVAVSKILDLITQFAGLAWNVDNGVVQITTPEAAKGAAVVQLYDVKDLATPINNFPGDEVNLDPTGEFVSEEEVAEPAPEFLLDQIQELIQTNVDPTTWEENGSVEALPPGTLVVKAPPSTHKKVQDLLDGLRGAGGLQVSIETRFVRVQDNFLQEVGVDLRGLGDQSGGVGVSGKGGITGTGGVTVPITFDDVFFGSAGTPDGIGTGNDVGIFYNLNSDGDIRARFENLFDMALGKEGVLTNLGGLSFQGTLIDDTQLEVILRAVEKNDRSTFVTAPRLTAYNGQRANVTILNQVSYISDFDVEIAQAAQIGDPIVQTISDGVVLDLRPTVSADRRFITMELRPTIAILTRPIATFQTTLANGPPVTIQLPELQVQRVRTTVTMPDGGTLLLGGLKFFEEQRMESTVPWLDTIPIASFFVKRQGTYLEKRNLLVLIRARILRPEENEPGIGSN